MVTAEREYMGRNKARMWTYVILAAVLLIGLVVANFAWENPEQAKGALDGFLGLPGWAIAGITAVIGAGVFALGLKVEAGPIPGIKTSGKGQVGGAVWYLPNTNSRTNSYMFMYGFDQRSNGIPLTRSKQERNLEELGSWVERLRQLPIGGVDDARRARSRRGPDADRIVGVLHAAEGPLVDDGHLLEARLVAHEERSDTGAMTPMPAHALRQSARSMLSMTRQRFDRATPRTMWIGGRVTF